MDKGRYRGDTPRLTKVWYGEVVIGNDDNVLRLSKSRHTFTTAEVSVDALLTFKIPSSGRFRL